MLSYYDKGKIGQRTQRHEGNQLSQWEWEGGTQREVHGGEKREREGGKEGEREEAAPK